MSGTEVRRLDEDERFKTAIDRFKNVSERKQLTAEAISNWSSNEILQRLMAEDVPCAPAQPQ